jgi:hypothetical protein
MQDYLFKQAPSNRMAYADLGVFSFENGIFQ